MFITAVSGTDGIVIKYDLVAYSAVILDLFVSWAPKSANLIDSSKLFIVTNYCSGPDTLKMAIIDFSINNTLWFKEVSGIFSILFQFAKINSLLL